MKRFAMNLSVILVLLPSVGAAQEAVNIDAPITDAMLSYQKNRDPKPIAELIATLRTYVGNAGALQGYDECRLRYEIANLSQIAYPSDSSYGHAVERYRELVNLSEDKENKYVLRGYEDLIHLLLLRGEKEQAKPYFMDLLEINEDLIAKAAKEKAEIQWKPTEGAVHAVRTDAARNVIDDEKLFSNRTRGHAKYGILSRSSKVRINGTLGDFALYYLFRLKAEEATWTRTDGYSGQNTMRFGSGSLLLVSGNILPMMISPILSRKRQRKQSCVPHSALLTIHLYRKIRFKQWQRRPLPGLQTHRTRNLVTSYCCLPFSELSLIHI